MRQQRFGNEDARRVDGRAHSGIYLSATFNTKNGPWIPAPAETSGEKPGEYPQARGLIRQHHPLDFCGVAGFGQRQH